jgi:hypothetical protein
MLFILVQGPSRVMSGLGTGGATDCPLPPQEERPVFNHNKRLQYTVRVMR